MDAHSVEVKFFDRQEDANPQNGSSIDDEKELLSLIEGLTGRLPFFCELISESNRKLLIGIGGSLGCVQFSASDRGPYLMATTVGSKKSNQHVEFLFSNTPTPIAARYCLQFEYVKKVAGDFLKTGNPSPAVDWEEV